MAIDHTGDEVPPLRIFSSARSTMTRTPLATAGALEGNPGEAGTAATAPRRASAAPPGRRCTEAPAPALNSYRGPPMTLGNAAAATGGVSDRAGHS
jgi:hypothetical protein